LVDDSWADRLLPILRHFTDRTPGSRIERKTASIAWHFRGAQRDFGLRQAHELRMLLGDALSNQPLEVLEGKKVIEIRFRGISKAVVAQRGHSSDRHRVTLAFGDDHADEDLFRELPPPNITVAVGQPLLGARFRIADHRAVRHLLRSLIAEEKTAPSAAQGVAATPGFLLM
jgi:trehalose 6-phosphate synthase/phosphatase